MSAFESAPRISPFLWMDANAEEAVNHYVAIFKNSRILETKRHHKLAPKGNVFTIDFELDGLRFIAMNGGPLFKFNEAVSLIVRCDSQEEVDFYWERLSEGGKPGRCCWLQDKFGLSWQIVPARLPELIRKPKAMAAMMGMGKPVIAELEAAAKE